MFTFFGFKERIKRYAFIIMSLHINVVWQACLNFTPDNIQHSFITFAASNSKQFEAKSPAGFYRIFG